MTARVARKLAGLNMRKAAFGTALAVVVLALIAAWSASQRLPAPSDGGIDTETAENEQKAPRLLASRTEASPAAQARDLEIEVVDGNTGSIVDPVRLLFFEEDGRRVDEGVLRGRAAMPTLTPWVAFEAKGYTLSWLTSAQIRGCIGLVEPKLATIKLNRAAQILGHVGNVSYEQLQGRHMYVDVRYEDGFGMRLLRASCHGRPVKVGREMADLRSTGNCQEVG